MLSEISARRVSVGLSLFAAVCAGYLAGSRALTLHSVPAVAPAATAEVPPSLANAPASHPRNRHSEFLGAGVTASIAAVSDKDRADALHDMLDLEVWRVSATRVTSGQAIEAEWVLREAGHPDSRLMKCHLGTNTLSKEAMIGKTAVIAALLPVGGSLTEAKHLRLRTQGTVGSHEGVVVNPFVGMNASRRENGSAFTARPNPHHETEILLMTVSKRDENFKATRTLRLILVLTTSNR